MALIVLDLVDVVFSEHRQILENGAGGLIEKYRMEFIHFLKNRKQITEEKNTLKLKEFIEFDQFYLQTVDQFAQGIMGIFVAREMLL